MRDKFSIAPFYFHGKVPTTSQGEEQIMLYTHPFRILYSPDGDGGSAPPGPDLETRLANAFASIVQKQGGNADAAGVLLLQENKAYRDEIRQLKEQLAQAQAKVPSEGAIILTAEDAATWQAYQELGKPDELKAVKGDFAKLQREALYSQAAMAHGYKPAVLGQLPGVHDLTIEIRDVEQDGQKRPSAFVKNGDGQERPLPDYVNEKWADFVPALQVAEPAPKTTPYPRQSAGGSPPAPANVVEATLDKRYKPPKGQEK